MSRYTPNHEEPDRGGIVFEAMWSALDLNVWALAVVAAVGVVLARWAARRWQRPFPATAMTVLGALGYLTATLVPASDGVVAAYPGRYCVWRPDLAAASAGAGGVVNLLLLVPLGAGLAMLGWRLVPTAITLGATAAAVEFVQAAVPTLGRSCDTTDALVNVAGGLLAWSAAGLVGGTGVQRADKIPGLKYPGMR
jgi:hypothetical protein